MTLRMDSSENDQYSRNVLWRENYVEFREKPGASRAF